MSGVLLDVRMNLTYRKEGKQYKPLREFVFVVDKPKYVLTNESTVIRNRECEELRFVIVDDETLDELIKILEKYKNSTTEDLK